MEMELVRVYRRREETGGESREIVHRQRCLVMDFIAIDNGACGPWTSSTEHRPLWGIFNGNGALQRWSGSSSTEHYVATATEHFFTAVDLIFLAKRVDF